MEKKQDKSKLENELKGYCSKHFENGKSLTNPIDHLNPPIQEQY